MFTEFSRCRELNAKVDESLYPVTDEQCDTPLVLRKARVGFVIQMLATLMYTMCQSLV